MIWMTDPPSIDPLLGKDDRTGNANTRAYTKTTTLLRQSKYSRHPIELAAAFETNMFQMKHTPRPEIANHLGEGYCDRGSGDREDEIMVAMIAVLKQQHWKQ